MSARAIRPLLTGALPALLLAQLACEPAHIEPYTPKKREIAAVQPAPPPDPESKGSVWRDNQGAGNLFADNRAYRVADIVVVAIEEKADAERTMGTDIERDSGSGMSLKSAPQVGLFADFTDLTGIDVPDFNADVTASGNSNTNFKHAGRSGRSESLVATVPAVVKEVLPNGNLVIEGHRVVLVNHEEQHLYISGIIRPIDIDDNNTVKSSMVAEAEVEFVGRGMVTDNSNQGWFSRTFGWWWPF